VTWNVAANVEKSVPDTHRDYWLGDLRDGGVLVMPNDDSRYFVVRRGAQQTRMHSESLTQLRVFAIGPGRDQVAFVEEAPGGSRIRINDLDGNTFASPRIDNVRALSWPERDTLLYVTGGEEGSILWSVRPVADGFAKPTRLFVASPGGALGALAARSGRIVASWVTSTYGSHLFARATRSDASLDKTAASAAIAWIDDSTFLTVSAGGAIERHSALDRVLPQAMPIRLPSEPANATIANDILITSLRDKAGRVVVAHALAESTPRWSTPAGALWFVRCAGDLKPPCVAGKQESAPGIVTLVTIDPQSGALGSDVIATGAIADAAVNAAGTEVAWVVDNRRIYVRPFDRSSPPRALDPEHPGGHTVAYDPIGGILGTVSNNDGRNIMRYHDGTYTSELTAGQAIVSLLRPSPNGERLLYRTRTLTSDLVEIR
jgi:hypothetical protein